MKHFGFPGALSVAVSLVLACACGLYSADSLAADAPVSYRLPDGWETGPEQAAVAAAISPDKTVRIIIRYFPTKGAMTALQIIKGQMAKVKHDKVVTPPTDMSQLKGRFNADSVAKMQLAGTATNGGKFLYRAFVFVKGNNFAVIEAIVNTKAGEAVFKQADGTIESFCFN